MAGRDQGHAKTDREDSASVVRRAQLGDVAAFREVVLRFQDMAYGYSLSQLRDEDLAQDAVQEAFLAAHRKLADLREPAAFPGWFRRILFTCCRGIRRGRDSNVVSLEHATQIEGRGSVYGHAAAKELRAEILDTIATLPRHERVVVMLASLDERPLAEVATFLGIPIGTVKSRLHAARARLKERMEHMIDNSTRGFRLPEGFADIVVRRVETGSDLRHAAEALSYHHKRTPEAFASPAAAGAAGVYVVGEPDHLRGAGILRVGRWGIGGTTVTCGFSQETTREGEGVPHPEFEAAILAGFKQARSQGCGLMIDHGSQFDHGLCGYVPSFFYPVATLPMRIAMSVTTAAVIEPIDGEAEQGGGGGGRTGRSGHDQPLRLPRGWRRLSPDREGRSRGGLPLHRRE